jgi:hypothetical protein
LLRHLVAYGNANMYKPVNTSIASGGNGEYVTQLTGFPCASETKLAMTVSVNAIESQRWI